MQWLAVVPWNYIQDWGRDVGSRIERLNKSENQWCQSWAGAIKIRLVWFCLSLHKTLSTIGTGRKSIQNFPPSRTTGKCLTKTLHCDLPLNRTGDTSCCRVMKRSISGIPQGWKWTLLCQIWRTNYDLCWMLCWNGVQGIFGPPLGDEMLWV